MRNNIIAIVIFIGFVLSVFTLGYVVSGDNIPLSRGAVPSISTSGGRSISRQTGDSQLAVGSMNSQMRSSNATRRSGSGRQVIYSQGSSGSGIHTSSSQTIHSIGSGTTSGASNVSGGSHSNVSAMGSSGSVGSIPMLSQSKTSKLSSSPAEFYSLANGYQPQSIEATFGDGDEKDPDAPDDNDDPFKTPLGELPIAVMILMVIAYVINKQRVRKIALDIIK